MQAWQTLAVAGGLTAIRVAAEHVQSGGDPSDTRSGASRIGDVSRIVVATAAVSFAATLAEQWNPALTRQLAALVLATSALVNGVALAQLSMEVINS